MAEFLTPTDIALELKLHRHTIYNELRSGRLKGFKPTKGRWRIKREDFDQYIKEKHNGHVE
jgi:excisionase family DNA binding protein